MAGIKPPILNSGDTIGIVTLGSPLGATVIDSGIAVLRDLGFQVVVGNHVYSATGFLAGTAEERADDLMMMFRNEDVKLILPTRGGVGVEGVLPYLDYEVIRANPKLISGYSDITILLNVIAQYADIITLQSLLLLDFSYGTPAYNFNQFFSAVSVYSPSRVIENPPGMPLVAPVQGDVTGEIVGGNLTSFVGSLGTPYEIDTDGKILLIEETHEPINTVYRYLNHLKIAGKLDACIGIVMGQCTNCPAAYGETYEDLINHFLVPLGKPLLANVATAHGYYKAAIPIGAQVSIDTEQLRMTVVEPTVSR